MKKEDEPERSTIKPGKGLGVDTDIALIEDLCDIEEGEKKQREKGLEEETWEVEVRLEHRGWAVRNAAEAEEEAEAAAAPKKRGGDEKQGRDAAKCAKVEAIIETRQREE